MLEHFGQRAIWKRAHALAHDMRAGWIAYFTKHSHRANAIDLERSSREHTARLRAECMRRVLGAYDDHRWPHLAWWRKYGEQL